MVNPYANKPRTQTTSFVNKPRFPDIPQCPKCPCPIPRAPVFFPKDVAKVFRKATFWKIQVRLNTLVDRLEAMQLRCNVKGCFFKVSVTGNTCCPYCHEVFCSYHRKYRNHDCPRDFPCAERYDARKHVPLRICKIYRPPVPVVLKFPYDKPPKVTAKKICTQYKCKPKKKYRDIELVLLKCQMNKVPRATCGQILNKNKHN